MCYLVHVHALYIACTINRISAHFPPCGGNLTLAASLIFILRMYHDALAIAEDYRMAFDVNMIVSTQGCAKVQFYFYLFIFNFHFLFYFIYFLLLSARRVREEHCFNISHGQPLFEESFCHLCFV